MRPASAIDHCVGIDVQVSRGLAYAILGADGSTAGATWASTVEELVDRLVAILRTVGSTGLGPIILPRPLPNPIDGVLSWPSPLKRGGYAGY